MKNSKLKTFFKYKLPQFFKYTLWKPFRCIKNYFFCLKYPFWRARNVFTDKPCGYEFTWYDDIPKGWRKAFGKQLSKDLKEALVKDNCLKEFRFSQIKEKWGKLRLYNRGCGENAEKVIYKYELMSNGFCYNCGKPARYCSSGWIEFYCRDCAKRVIPAGELAECRLTKKDITIVSTFDKNGKEHKVDLKKEYDIDFAKLWRLNDDKNTKK